MAKQPDAKHRFKSRFGGGFVTDGQYLAESMCDRMARKDKTELPLRFWDLPRWKREFRLQAMHAASLLRLYSVDAVIRALRTTRGKSIYSLAAPFLDPLVATEQERLTRQLAAAEARAAAPATPVPTTNIEPPRPAFVEKKSLLSKLREV